ncbi:hypothetical protein AB0M46_18610 [Dactylosporangium sp. NPDC051485]|uniref:hypothetical protein n=1 Tax=Dactylosporangium sp. NPDC051485 TaxID=3154846 RepID=UPI00343F1ADB
MNRKPLTTRTVVITTASMITGSAVGTATETVAAYPGHTGSGVGPAITAIAALWVLDKLNTLVDDQE